MARTRNLELAGWCWSNVFFSSVMYLMLFFFFRTVGRTSGELEYGFYDATCPNVEETARQVLQLYFTTDPTSSASIRRLSFHDCQVQVLPFLNFLHRFLCEENKYAVMSFSYWMRWTVPFDSPAQGCDASVMLVSANGITTELDASSSFSIRRLDIIGRGEGDARGSLPEHSIFCRHHRHGRPWSSGLCWWSPNHHSFREEGFDFRKHLGSMRKSPATDYQHGPIHELVCYLRHESSWECCHHGFVHFAHQFFTTSGGPCFLAGWWTDARFSIRELQLYWKYVVNQC